MVSRRLSFTTTLVASTLGAVAMRKAKNAARLLLGRPLQRRDNRAFSALLAHITGLRPIGYVTHSPAPGEGAGAQALSMLMARSLAAAIGKPYLHHPFTDLNHTEGDPAHFARQWEDMLGLGLGERLTSDARGSGLDTAQLFVSDAYNRSLGEQLFAGIGDMVPDLRNRYYRNHAPTTNGRLQVAIHVRRGDVSPLENAYMWTPLGDVRRAIETIVQCLKTRESPYDLTVISQGKPEDFVGFDGIGCRLVLDEPATQSFARMVEADILVMAKSSYSYLAALLCDGLVIYPDCAYPPQQSWLKLGRGLDAARLEARLQEG